MAKLAYAYTENPIAATPTQPAGKAYRPQQAATITAPNGQSVRFLAILDSGADACVFPMIAATLLGLDILSLRKAYTAGVGSQANVTVYANVTIDLGDGITFRTEAGFTQGLDAIGVGLLGQTGFFENYNVEFRYAEKIFTVEPAS
jgi:hypothetical protein